MELYDLLLANKINGGGGGGSSVTVEPLSVTSNGTYSETGKAYSPVNVSVPTPSGSTNISANGTYDVTDFASASVAVPNSYSASDEGKVVSNGALVAQTSQTIDSNGTYDTTLKNSVTVNVSGGGGGYELVASKEITVSIGTSTTATSIGSIEIPTQDFTDKACLIVIRNKNGKEASHFYASFAYRIINSTDSITGRTHIRVNQNYDSLAIGLNNTSSALSGVYINTLDQFVGSSVYGYIYAKYNSSTSYAVDGTYVVEVYAVDYPPNIVI